jgi:hypothetical protein
MLIGCTEDSSAFYPMSLDDLGIFDKILTPSEVNDIYQGMTLGEYLGAGSATTKLLLHLNGNSADSSGNNNNGTDTAITYVDGKFGKCASFNGSSSFIQTPYSNASSEFTQVFWFKCSSLTTNQTLSGQTTSALPKYWFLIGRNNHPTFPRKLIALVSGGSTLTMYGTTNVDDGNWHMGAIVLKSGASALYVDGKLEDSDATTYTVPTTSMPTHYIGKTGDNDSYLNGSSDEHIYDAVAWTPQQVAKYYSYTKGYYATL